MSNWKPSGPVVLVLRIDADDAAWLADIAFENGLRCFEVTATQPDFQEAFASIKEMHPDAQVGIGSLRSPADLHMAASLGPDYLVTPVAVSGGAKLAHEAGIGYIEGAATPTECHRAAENGADIVKVFPAASLGGISYLRDLLAPMPDLSLMPSGGVTPENAQSYLEAGASAVSIGSSLCSATDLDSRDSRNLVERLAVLPK